MKLNRAQLLVHDDTALEKFRANHGIPNDIRIERFGPKEDANLVEGNEDRILVRIWLIYQAGLRFFISPTLKKVMAVYRLTFKQVRNWALDSLRAQESPPVPNKVVDVPILVLSSEVEDSDDLAFTLPYTMAVQGLPPVPQPVLAITILDKVESSLLEATLLDKCKGKKQPSEGLSKRRKKKMGTNTAFTLSPGEQAELWKPKFSISSGSLALALAFMLPNDVVDLATVG
ncbi:hypothetical protein Acr_05g0012810 [Actinidia rufa]|uniref:Uncharacterized protein n=1 Tax=Actinidia rufa TaxID=165716 RepID=A0A7J0EMU6_9ERIC|nr:hypothetical protein Acr_05g0012810 [Actinidia rufa]